MLDQRVVALPSMARPAPREEFSTEDAAAATGERRLEPHGDAAAAASAVNAAWTSVT